MERAFQPSFGRKNGVVCVCVCVCVCEGGADGGWGGGGYSQTFWVGGCRSVLKTLTLFQTKIYAFPYPFSDRLKAMTFRRSLFSFSIYFEDECPWSMSKITREIMNMCGLILSCQNHTLFQTKKAKSITLFQTITAPKPYPLGRHIPI